VVKLAAALLIPVLYVFVVTPPIGLVSNASVYQVYKVAAGSPVTVNAGTGSVTHIV
jgi:hypothetical protein